MIRRPSVVALLLLACACTSHHDAQPMPSSTPVATPAPHALSFRKIVDGGDPSGCVRAPDFAAAITEDQWIDLWDQETVCDRVRDVTLPTVDFAKEIVLAAWWTVLPCGHQVQALAVTADGTTLRVEAARKTVGVGNSCKTERMQASFLAVRMRCADAANLNVEFDLDAKRIATTQASGTCS